MMAYQHESYIREALDALLAQTCTSFKLVAIDDGSKDSTYSILKDYEAGPLNGSMTVLTHPGHANHGIYAGYRRCLEDLDTEFFMPHASDDFLLPGAIEYLLSLMDANQDFDFAYGPCHVVDSTGGFTGALDGTQDLGHGLNAFCTLLRSNPVREPTMFFRANCSYIVRQNKSNIPYGDWLQNLSFFTRCKPLRYEIPVVAYRHHGANVSIGTNVIIHRQRYREVLSAALANMSNLLEPQFEPLLILVGSSLSPPPSDWPSQLEAEARVQSRINDYSYFLLRSLFDRQTFATLPAGLAACIIVRAGWIRGVMLSLYFVLERRSFSSFVSLIRSLVLVCCMRTTVNLDTYH